MNAQTARKQLEKRLARLRAGDPSLAVPPRGWVTAIREALGMSAVQLARRLGVKPSRINAIQKAEISGAITIKSMREAAEAMNCKFVYALVPIEPLEKMVEERARLHAAARLQALDHTMALEDQSIDAEDRKAQEDWIIREVLEKEARRLWNEP